MSDEIAFQAEFMLYNSFTPVLAALTSFRIADLLETGPKSAEELASLASISPSRLFRYLRLASYFQVFALDSETNKWTNTKRSLYLTSPLTRSFFELYSFPKILENYAHATALLASDQEPHLIKNTPHFFDLFAQNPDMLLKFQKKMTDYTSLTLNQSIDSIDIGASQNVLDVGGADGSLLLGILKQHAHLKGGVFDRPEVEPIAIKNICDNGFGETVRFHEGNFFESVTGGYDCIVMKHILHDWNDEKASLILKNCRKALKEGDKLFVIDRIIDKNSEFYAENLGTDFWMLVLLGAKERTVDEFEKLFSKNGFKLSSVKKVSFEAVIEAVAV